MNLFKNTLPVFFSLAMLSACGGGGGGDVTTNNVKTYSLGGTVAGLSGSNVVRLLNNGSDLATVSANGSFTFSTALSSGATYNVTVGTKPAYQDCTVVNGTGTLSGSVTNVTVTCATTENVLHNFVSTTGVVLPFIWFVDGSGSLFGTTPEGGSGASGTAFKLTPGGSGDLSILYNFSSGSDGAFPSSGLIADGSGNLFGTTTAGGIGSNGGTVFKLTPNGSGGYVESVVHTFIFGTPDSSPGGALILDNNGNFFGTSKYFSNGVSTATVFKLTPNGSGGYVESVVHLFNGGSDGTGAIGLIGDDHGNLYGTTFDGGSSACGSVFQLSPDGSGGYVSTMIHGFAGGLSDGCSLMGGVILDGNGNLFGTTADGGANGNGTVFKLTPNGSGGFVESILYNFAGGIVDGAQPQSSLVIDRNGNVFGTTTAGGASGYGTVFELIPNGSGGYSESLLYSFAGGTSDGAVPSGLIIDSSGNLFGATVDGGSSGVGAVFEIAH